MQILDLLVELIELFLNIRLVDLRDLRLKRFDLFLHQRDKALVQGCFARLERLGLLTRERDMGAASVTQVGLLASEGIAAHGEGEVLPA